MSNFTKCFWCQHWTRKKMLKLKYRKSFKWLRIKYWIFWIKANNPFAYGHCDVNILHEEYGFVTKGTDRCVFEDMKDQIGELTKDSIEEDIRKISQSRTKNP